MITACKYPSYIFDLDGTLTDSSIAIGEGVIAALHEVGINHLTITEVRKWIGRPLSEIFPAYMKQYKVPYDYDEILERRLVEAYRRGHDAHFPVGVKYYPSVLETLTHLRSCGAKIAVATTKYEEAAMSVAKGIGLLEHVDTICGTDPGFSVKPDPYVIQLALTRLNARPFETLVVGDTAADILAAHSAGCPAAAVSYGFGNITDMRKAKPEFWLDSIREIP